MNTQMYRYKISYWFLFLFGFAACELMAFGTFTKNLPDLLGGKFDILDYVVFFIIILICFPLGLFSLAVPFFAKIILSPYGIELHTISAIVKANWSDLSIGIIQAPSGSSQTLVCSRCDITLRQWAKYLPWDVERGVRELGIPFSHFGGLFTSQDLFEAITQHAPCLRMFE